MVSLKNDTDTSLDELNLKFFGTLFYRTGLQDMFVIFYQLALPNKYL